MKPIDFSDLPKPLAIVGMGVTGDAIRELLISSKIPDHQVLTFDEKSTNAQFQSIVDLIKIGQPQTLIVSPGVPLQSPWLIEAKKNGISIVSELSLASRFLTSEKLIAITGSIGKSTTTCLLQAALEKFCPSYFVGGNLGVPLAVYANDLINKKRPRAQWIVLELSSYQLENFPELNADYSIITYFTANHLERYKSKEDYYSTKWSIEKNTKKTLILNSNGGELQSWVKLHPSHLPCIWTNRNDPLIQKFNLHEGQLLGVHNQDNIALAAQVLSLAQWPESSYLGLAQFQGLPHRVENLGFHNGLRFINDSKATTMESVSIAVQSVLETTPKNQSLHLLLGGKDKNLPWQELRSLNSHSQLRFYFFGECRDKAKTLSQLNGETFSTMIEAATSARSSSLKGDSILLSPGGTSLDEFKNFEHRGEVFKKFAHEIKI